MLSQVITVIKDTSFLKVVDIAEFMRNSYVVMGKTQRPGAHYNALHFHGTVLFYYLLLLILRVRYYQKKVLSAAEEPDRILEALSPAGDYRRAFSITTGGLGMEYEKIVEGRFISRPNRFIAHVEVDGRTVVSHVKNTGRCRELLLPGARVFWSITRRRPRGKRKTAYDLIGVYKGDTLINMDSPGAQPGSLGWMQTEEAAGVLAGGSSLRACGGRNGGGTSQGPNLQPQTGRCSTGTPV